MSHVDILPAEETVGLSVEYLEEAKRSLMELSETEGHLVDLGTLSGGKNEHLWNQGEKAISLARRKASGEVTPDEEAAAATRLPKYFVPVSKGARKRCVDGSSAEGYDDDDPRSYGNPLGPQIQGGTADEAFAFRLTQPAEEAATATLLDDIETVASDVKSDFAIGDHTDDHATHENCGCGAIMGFKRKLTMYSNPEAAPVVRGTADTLLGFAQITPAPDAFDGIQATAQVLAQNENYFPPSTQDVLKKLVELNPDALEKLIRPHGEISATINFVRGTTFHRDSYNAATGRKLQNFNLDAWDIIDEYGDKGYALVVDAVETLMDLTDGTLRLFVRLPRESDDAVLQQAA